MLYILDYFGFKGTCKYLGLYILQKYDPNGKYVKYQAYLKCQIFLPQVIVPLGDKTTQIFDILVKIFMPHHGLKELQHVMSKLLICGPHATFRYVEKNYRKLVIMSKLCYSQHTIF